LFCFTSDLRGFLLEWCFRSFTSNFHFIFERRHGDNGIELARFFIILFEVVRSCATFSLAFTRFCLSVGGGKFSWARAVSFCQASGSRSFLLGVCFRGLLLALVFLFVRW
jgi:hypothetical protein